METSSYGAFSERIHRSLREHAIPLTGTIEVTRRCPLACAHCYNNLPMADRRAQLEELTTAEHCSILDDLADMGCLWLLFTGGEIFARPDFLDIYAHAKRNGLIVTLFTNGNLITPRVADQLAEQRPFSIEITLYGRTRETYERLTAVPGSYDRCLRGIQLLIERQLPLSLKTVALTINKHEVWDMQRFAEEELGVPFKFDPMISPRIDCSLSPLAVRLSPEEVVSFDMLDHRRFEEWQEFGEHHLRATETPACGAGADLYDCGGGISSFAIDPYGRMSICVLSHADTYDVRAGSVRAGWEEFLHRVRQKKTKRLTKCQACSLKSLCGMCPANGELENGDPEAPVDFLCRVAHLRAHAFGFAVPPHGDCEYCEHGSGFADLMQSVAALKQIHPLEHGELPAPGRPGFSSAPATGKRLPMVASQPVTGGCSSGGCTSCARPS
jgi:radical SAM protein with 4Fe4S-binding SPASM domain